MPALYVGAAATVAGAASSIANSGGGSTSSTTRPFNSGYLDNGDQDAWWALNNYYAGKGNANDPFGFPEMSPEAQSGIRAGMSVTPANRAYLDAAQGGANNFANGSYLGSNPAYRYLGGMAQGGASNPYLDATFTHAAGQVRNALDSQFAQAGGNAGMYGSPQQQGAMASNLNDLATNLYGGQYNADMNRQLQAGSVLGQIGQGERQQQISGIGLAPSLTGGQIANYQGLLGAGQYQDTYNHNAYMNPLSMIQGYQNVIATGNSGGVNSQPYFTNPTAGVLGSAALGLDAYRTFSGSGSGGYVNPVSDPYASMGGPSGGMSQYYGTNYGGGAAGDAASYYGLLGG